MLSFIQLSHEQTEKITMEVINRLVQATSHQMSHNNQRTIGFEFCRQYDRLSIIRIS